MLKGMCTTTVANNARFALPSDVVQYIEKSLTKKEMKKKTVGRKSINYPKRSEIIKIDPVKDLPEISEKEIIESNFKHDDDKENEHLSKSDENVPAENHFKIDHLFYCSKCPNFYENERSLKDHVILMHWEQKT